MEQKFQEVKKEIKELVGEMLVMEHETPEYQAKEKRLDTLIETKNKIFEEMGA